jgi:hypothetical protein
MTYDGMHTPQTRRVKPRQMSPERLQELYVYAWETFYRDEPQNYKMFKLFKRVVEREKEDGTFRPRRRSWRSAGSGGEAKDEGVRRVK